MSTRVFWTTLPRTRYVCSVLRYSLLTILLPEILSISFVMIRHEVNSGKSVSLWRRGGWRDFLGMKIPIAFLFNKRFQTDGYKT